MPRFSLLERTFFFLLLTAEPLAQANPWSVFWTTPAILFASVVITWGAESAQFFVAQGFALAILAWMQTLPEFAVEAVLAWKQQTELLMANLTGAVRLLTGLAWPMIYLTAAVVHRRKSKSPLGAIKLDPHHSVEVIGLFFPLVYSVVIWWKATLHLYDGLVLIVMYVVYLGILMKLPPQKHEAIEDLEGIPKRIVTAPRGARIAGILACFVVGGVLIYLVAAPFLGSLISLATAIGIPSFIVIQWLAPVISEFPELLSTFYFARQEEKAPVALMNIASSNINQWTLLFAMLPIVYSMSRHAITGISLDSEQQAELLLTIAQSVIGLVFLLNMRFAWWEATAMFVLFIGQFFAGPYKPFITDGFLIWAAFEFVRMLVRWQKPVALAEFQATWKAHVHVSR